MKRTLGVLRIPIQVAAPSLLVLSLARPLSAAEPASGLEARLESAQSRQAQAEKDGKTALARRLSALVARLERVIDALEKAAALEKEVETLEAKRLEVETKTSRAITLVEQTDARRARTLAKLQALGIEPKGESSVAPASAVPASGAGSTSSEAIE